MSEIPFNRQAVDNQNNSDFVIIHLPVVDSVMRNLQLHATECSIQFEVDKSVNIFSPIEGGISKIVEVAAKPEYTVEVLNDFTRCILTGFNMLFITTGNKVKAGSRLGRWVKTHSREKHYIQMHIVSLYPEVNFQTNLKIR